MKLNEVHNIDQAMSEGTVYDMDKEYGAPAPKHKPVIARGASSRYDPEAVDPMHPDQRRFQADQDRYLKAQRDAIAKMKAEKGLEETTTDNPEYTDEVGYVKDNLHTIARMCKVLNDTMIRDENLPDWVQEKVANAKGMLVAATDYLESQHEQGRVYTNSEEGMAEGSNVDSQIKRIKDRILQLKDWNTTGSHDKKIKELQTRLKELQSQKQGVAEGSEKQLLKQVKQYSADDLDDVEELFIIQYNSRNSKYGYNKKAGGANHSLTDEQIQNLIDNFSGENAFWFGKERSEETIEKIKQTKKKQGVSKGVICYDINTFLEIARYNSIEDAMKATTTTRATIARHCNTKTTKVTGKYIWRYESDGLEVGFQVKKIVRTEEMKKAYSLSKKIKGISKGVICFDKETGLEVARFDSIDKASESGLSSRPTILEQCKGIQRKTSYSKYFWKYIN